MILFDADTGKEIERHSDEIYSGGNILYDKETDLFFRTSRGRVKAFRIKE